MLRPVEITDARQIGTIYNHFVRETIVTFEEEPVDEAEMARRIESSTDRHPWWVWVDEAELVGYAYAAPWKSRSAYRESVETTVYVRPDCDRRGIGTKLYERLLRDCRERGFHVALAGIALPNPASVAFHEKLGFRKVGQLEEVGLKFGRRIDVGYWELRLHP